MRYHSLTGLNLRRTSLIILALLVLAVVSILFACATGSVSLGIMELLRALPEFWAGQRQTLAASLLELRWSRALTGFVTGGSLALAGTMMQALLRNPLADPYVLGVSSGASVAALASILFFGFSWWVDLAAFGGALLISFLLLLLARQDFRGHGGSDGRSPLLILTGVILATGCGAMITLMLTIAPEGRLRGMVFWMIGDLSHGQFRWLPWLILALVLGLLLRHARAINLLAMHAENALTLGVSVAKVRLGLFMGSALLTASAVANAGSVGFVGLILPHACRFVLGPDHRLLLPAVVLTGGSFLVLADTLARTVVAPQQLPVGVITAMIGVPVFLIQLYHLRKR